MSRVLRVFTVLVLFLVVTCCGSPTLRGGNTWSWRPAQLPGIAGGLRATAYSQSCNCLWVLTRVQSGQPYVALNRFNLGDGSASTALNSLPALGFIRGSITVDPAGGVWMAWGRFLYRYEPSSATTMTWALPGPGPESVRPIDPALDGNAVALDIDANGEVWVAVHSVAIVYGFNPSISTWDRTISLPFVPNQLTRIVASPRSTLTLNGVEANDALVVGSLDTKSGLVSVLPPHARAFVVVGSKVVFEGVDHSSGKVDPLGGTAVTLAPLAPVAGDPALAVDASGNVWFSMVAKQSIGLGKLDPLSGAITAFPFPPPTGSPLPGPVLCPPTSCTDSSLFDPQIQSIVADSAGDIWVTTSVPGAGGDQAFASSASPLYELVGQ